MKRLFASKGILIRLAACFAGASFAASYAVAQTPSPALLVLEKTDSTLAIVDPASLKIVGRVPAGSATHEVIASADGKFAYVTNYNDQKGPRKELAVIDLAAEKALAPVDLGALRAPHGITFAGGKVYFTAEANKVIGRYDPATKQVDWVLGTGQNFTHMVAVSKDLNTLFTSNIGSNTICVIEQIISQRGGKDWNVTPIPVGKGPEGFDVSPDEKQVWAANSQDGSVSIIDLATKKVVETIDVKTKHSNRLKFTPDGKLALISDPEGGILVIVDTASHQVVKTLDVGRGVEGIQLQPDGARAFAAVSEQNSVAVVDLKTLQVTGHITGLQGPDGMAWAVR
jgi:YVTN family beta-propeller protein